MWRRTGIDRSVALFVGLLAVSLVLVTVDLRASGAGIGGTLRDGTQTAFTPIQKGVGFVTRPVVGFFEGVSDLIGVRGENHRLTLQVADLERQVAEAQGLQQRISELEKILGVEPPEAIDAITARVMAVGVSDFDLIRLIDKGREQGVTEDMPVVDEGGLVGRVVMVTDTSARIRLITDPTMRVAVRLDRTGETGILIGRGSGPMSLEMLNTNAALVAGDLLVTADGRFPAGIAVARVVAAARADVGFVLRTSAVPTAELTRIDFVKVLVFTSDAVGGGGQEGQPDGDLGESPGTTLTP
jgi:rod shape-determining protein MreC